MYQAKSPLSTPTLHHPGKGSTATNDILDPIEASLAKLSRACKCLEKEMVISRCMKPAELDAPQVVLVAKTIKPMPNQTYQYQDDIFGD